VRDRDQTVQHRFETAVCQDVSDYGNKMLGTGVVDDI